MECQELSGTRSLEKLRTKNVPLLRVIDVKLNINHNGCDRPLCCYNNVRLSIQLCKYKCDYLRHVVEYLTLAIINSRRACIKMNHRFVDERHVCTSLRRSAQPLTTCYDLIARIPLGAPPIPKIKSRCASIN
jgi:hypothetical protein